MKLEEKLLTLRKEKGLSQLELAEMLDVSRQAISRWEVGTSVPSVDNLKYLGKLYGVPLDYLLNDDATLQEPQEQPAPKEPEQKATAAGTGTKRWIVVLVAIMTVVAVLLCVVFLKDEPQKPVPMNQIEGSEVEEDSTIDFDVDF